MVISTRVSERISRRIAKRAEEDGVPPANWVRRAILIALGEKRGDA